MKRIIIVFALLFYSCGTDNSTEVAQDEPNTIFTIKYGEVKSINYLNLQVGFRDVNEDSRCPQDVLCNWAGLAELRLWIKPVGKDTINIIAPIHGYVTSVDSLRHIYVDTLGYKISVLQLDPYPISRTTFPEQNYTALIKLLEK